MKNKKIKLISCILLSEAAGIIGSVFTAESVATWYKEIERPSFTPPDYVFGPVWTILFAMMGVFLYLVIESKSRYKNLALTLFGIQLALNTLWSFLFFGMQNPRYAFYEICVLWIFIFATTVVGYKIKKSYALWFIPYLLWVSFASVLNYAFLTTSF